VGINDDAVANDANRMGMDDADGQKVQSQRFAVVDDGVPSIGAALETDDDVGFTGEAMDDSALPLIAPLRPDDDQNCHPFASFFGG
jgi:hypothetical protein